MAKSANRLKQPPPAFSERNQHQFQRTVQLTRQAIERLEAAGNPVTLAAVCQATRPSGTDGKALSAVTILRNSEAAALFRQHSPAVQARYHRARTAKRRRSRVNAGVRALYHGLRASDLIELIEALKQQVRDLKRDQDKLMQERAAAYRLRDEALNQNTRQLAALTALQDERTVQSPP